MSMAADGLAKLIEECGELIQVAGKKLAYYHTDDHPDGGGGLSHRMEEEMGDVIAAIRFVAENFNLDLQAIAERANTKQRRFEKWHADPTNNEHGVDSLAAAKENGND